MSSAIHAGRLPAVGGVRSEAEVTAGAVSGREPHCIVLEAREPETGPPVRIYLGTEAAQYRAERIFIWSIEQVRSPARRYEIHLLRDLAGFNRLGWTTGFTNHRFAVPHYAGASGVAIYNDVDQIYLRDPAELFDLDLGGHGFLAIGERETSVMLIDCERMARVWSLEDAQQRSKRALIRKALAVPGLVGPLDGGWNCRDEDEYAADSAYCYHFTTLHTQPWRPFPERFVYHEHPHARLWWDLKASADAAGYRVFDRAEPSPGYRSARGAAGRPERPVSGERHADRLAALLERSGVASAVEFVDGGRGVGPLKGLEVSFEPPIDVWGLSGTGAAAKVGAAVAISSLDALPADDVPWVLGEIFERAERAVFLVVRQRRSGWTPPWRSPVGGVRGRTWWLDQVELAARAAPGVEWELVLEPEAGGPRSLERGGPWRSARPPRVWLVTDDSPGAAAQARCLADALGWPAAERRLAFGPGQRALQAALGAGAWCERVGTAPAGWPTSPRAEQEWPDLVIAAGRHTAPAARWVRAAGRRPCRAVHIDVGGAAPADDFDRVVTPLATGAMAHPQRSFVAGPLVAGPSQEEPRWVQDWLRVAEEGRQVWLLLDPDVTPDRVGALVEEKQKAASQCGAALAVSLHRDAPRPLEQAVRAFAEQALSLPRWHTDDQQPALWARALAPAERLVVASRDPVLGVAARRSGRPVDWPVLPETGAPRPGLRDRLVARAFARPENDRGTTRPQMGIERILSRWVARGVLLPSPSPERALEALRSGSGGADGPGDLERLAARIRSWFSAP
ncbi:MAG: ELM1/GtrOC1 family putative glycosyltransferase [Myxococcota bacterium]